MNVENCSVFVCSLLTHCSRLCVNLQTRTLLSCAAMRSDILEINRIFFGNFCR